MSVEWTPSPRLLLTQSRSQNRIFWRIPVAAFFTLVLPTGMMVLFNSLFDGTVDTADGPISITQFYTAGLAAFAAVSATYTNLVNMIPIRRDEGILKRVRGTPLPPWIYIGGVVLSAVWIAAIGVTGMLTLSVVAYDFDIEAAKLPGAVLTFVVGIGAFSLLGLAVAALVPSAEAAPAVANATILPLAFISNIFIPLEDPPRWVEVLGNIFPLKHFVVAFQDAFNPFVDAPGIQWDRLGYLVLWGAIGAVVALRYFRWEPYVGKARSGRRGRRRRSVEEVAA